MQVREALSDELPACVQVRREVFVVGQGVPEAIEQDGRDGLCRHAVARVADRVVGTARLRVTSAGEAKAERVAVLASARGSGLGRQLMDVLEAMARADGHGALVLNAQADVIGFYEHLGYVGEGRRFFEADIEHWTMRKRLVG